MKYYNITVNGVAYSVSVEETAAGAAPLQLPLLPPPQGSGCSRRSQGCCSRRCCRCRYRQGSHARQHPGCQGCSRCFRQGR